MSKSFNHSLANELVQTALAAAKAKQLNLASLYQLPCPDQSITLGELLDSGQRMSLANFDYFLRVFWDFCQDEAGAFLERPLKPGAFAMMCHACINSPNLGRSLQRGGRFMQLMSDEFSLQLETQGDEVSLILDYKNTANLDASFFILSTFIVWLRWSCWQIKQPILLERVHFNFAKPDYASEFNLMFPCRHYFDQNENKLVFAKQYLDKAVLQDSQSLIEFLAKAPAYLLTQYKDQHTTTSRLKNYLLESPNPEAINLDNAADYFNTSSHTLRRKLKQEGFSFQEIKDTIRRDQAIYQLTRKTTSISEIADNLGFSEPAGFNRAFKKWTGLSPGAYRKQYRS